MRKNLAKKNTDFSVQSFEGGYDKNFSYIVTCLQTMNSAIIDASLEPGILKPFQKSNPVAILITHSHYDHISHVHSYKECYPDIKLIEPEKEGGQIKIDTIREVVSYASLKSFLNNNMKISMEE